MKTLTDKFNDYRKLTVRTFSHGEYIIPNISSFELDILHCVIGIVTEIQELYEHKLASNVELNYIEEMGDIFWYCSNLERLLDTYNEENNLGITLERDYDLFKDEQISDTQSTYNELYNLTITNMLDTLKKVVFYRKPIDSELLVKLNGLNCEIISRLLLLLRHEMPNTTNDYVTVVGDILDKNIKKLQARYPNKFTTEHALDRNIENEYKSME